MSVIRKCSTDEIPYLVSIDIKIAVNDLKHRLPQKKLNIKIEDKIYGIAIMLLASGKIIKTTELVRNLARTIVKHMFGKIYSDTILYSLGVHKLLKMNEKESSYYNFNFSNELMKCLNTITIK